MKRGGGDEMGEERRYSNLIFYYFIFFRLGQTLGENGSLNISTRLIVVIS
jgi:hypothetical protein